MKLITLAVIAASAILASAAPSEETLVSQRPALADPADIDAALVKTLDEADALARNLVESLAGKSEVARLEAAGLNLLVHDAAMEAAVYARVLKESNIELPSERPELSSERPKLLFERFELSSERPERTFDSPS